MRIKGNKNKKVVVAMSGGLDSSVAAALLKKVGFDVRGVFMELWPSSSKFSKKRAKKIAELLEIPFQVLNFEKEFKKKVVDYFLKEYKAGRTPNPCVVCNKKIKFGLLLEKAQEMGADFVATGHYAKVRELKNQKSKVKTYKLLRAKDKKKDQSYFLWQLNQKQMKRVLFPIGNYTKKEVRNLAKKFKLPVLNIPESQEICFVAISINDFLSKYLKSKSGKIVDIKGNIIGEHQGLHFYTIGQRKGLKLAGGPSFAKATAGKPWYVLDKNTKKNFLIVTQNEKDLKKKELIAENVNWIPGKTPELPQKVKVKIRYKSPLAQAKIIKKIRKETFKVIFLKKQRAITPGQSIVFYKGQEVSGGGIIRK